MKQSKVLSVVDTGAKPNTEQLQTEAFQRALDQVYFFGGGTVEVPAGVWHIGGIRLRSDTTLYLKSGAILIGTRDPEQYGVLENDTLEPIPDSDRTDHVWEPAKLGVTRDYSFLRAGGRWNHGMIRALDAENISIVGEKDSVIDGSDCYDEAGEEHYRGPHGINLHRCRNVTFRGYTIRNTGNWAHAVYYSENVNCEDVTVLGGHDGIHLTRCGNTAIRRCSFYTGDDCIAGFGNLNTLVENCICNTACSSLRFGGTNLLVCGCRFYGPAKYLFRGSLTKEEKRASAHTAVNPRNNMLSVFTYYADYSVEIPIQPGNLVFRDCVAENADRFLHYNFSGNEVWQLNRPLQSVRFENVTARGISMPLTAYGDQKIPLVLELVNVSVGFTGAMAESPCMKAAYCERILMDRVAFSGKTNGELVRSWAPVGDVICREVSSETPILAQVAKAVDPFTCKPI